MRAFLFAFMAGGLILALWAQWRMRSAYRRWSSRASAMRPLTGAGAAREILDAADLADVPVERSGGHRYFCATPAAVALGPIASAAVLTASTNNN